MIILILCYGRLFNIMLLCQYDDVSSVLCSIRNVSQCPPIWNIRLRFVVGNLLYILYGYKVHVKQTNVVRLFGVSRVNVYLF